MKNTIKAFIALFMIAGFSSCESEDNFMIAEPQQGAFAILTPDSGSTVVITEPTAQSNNAITFTWEDVDYGTPTAVTYTVEFAANATEFAVPREMTSSSSRIFTIDYETLNTVATALSPTPVDAENPQQVAIDVRVKSTIGTIGAEPKYSDVITILVTPFKPAIVIVPTIYVVGGFQGASGYGSDWTPATAVPLLASSVTTTDFEGYVFFSDASAQYKFLPTNSSFEGDYGDTGASDGSYSETLEQEGEVNAGLPATGAGYYLVKANTTTLAYSLQLTSWAITGDATPAGWASDTNPDTNMTYDPASKTWKITIDLLAGFKIKFRANDAWDLNLGDTGADGSLNYGGDDIVIQNGGSYTVSLDLSNPRAYTYTLTAN